MKREDYMFCIGYQGDAAVIDGQARKRYAGAAVEQLLAAGMYRAALCAALYDGDQESLEEILRTYNELSGAELRHKEDAMRLWGVVPPSDALEKTLVIK